VETRIRSRRRRLLCRFRSERGLQSAHRPHCACARPPPARQAGPLLKTDGVDSPIQITMPKGTYVPRPFVLFPNRGVCRSSLVCRAAAPGTDVGFFTGADAQTVAETHAASTKPPVRWVTGLGRLRFYRPHFLFFSSSGSSRAVLNRRDIPVAGEALPFMRCLARNKIHRGLRMEGTGLFLECPRRRVSSNLYPARRSIGAVPADPGDACGVSPVWSPNGREIAFLSYVSPSSYEVVRAPLNGGTERTVGVVFVPLDFIRRSARSRLVTRWEKSVGCRAAIEHFADTAHLFDLATGNRRPLTNPPAGIPVTSMEVLSDGSEVAFRRGGLGDLYLVRQRGRPIVPLLN